MFCALTHHSQQQGCNLRSLVEEDSMKKGKRLETTVCIDVNLATGQLILEQTGLDIQKVIEIQTFRPFD